MGGQRKQFDPETQEDISLAIEYKKLELGMALATGANSSFLDHA